MPTSPERLQRHLFGTVGGWLEVLQQDEGVRTIAVHEKQKNVPMVNAETNEMDIQMDVLTEEGKRPTDRNCATSSARGSTHAASQTCRLLP